MDTEEIKQRRLFDRLAREYEKHHSDQWSEEYQKRFINHKLIQGIPLQGKKVLEAMCGSGQMTSFLLSQGAEVTGLDISSHQISAFRKRFPSCVAICESITHTSLPRETFDCIVLVGGLHHLHPQVNQAIANIHRLLKPGAYFCFVEPHGGSLPDVVRKIWYKFDGTFEDNEAAVDFAELEEAHCHRFRYCESSYGGWVAYLFVLQSMVFRIHPQWKRYYAGFLLSIESLIQKLYAGKRLSCYRMCRWKRI